MREIFTPFVHSHVQASAEGLAQWRQWRSGRKRSFTKRDGNALKPLVNQK